MCNGSGEFSAALATEFTCLGKTEVLLLQRKNCLQYLAEPGPIKKDVRYHIAEGYSIIFLEIEKDYAAECSRVALLAQGQMFDIWHYLFWQCAS